MQESILTSYVLPVALFLIMLGMGMSLVVEDFKRILHFPKVIFLGLINQLLFLPLIGFVVVSLFHLEPIYTIGIMLLAACPGGLPSNLITFVAKGDTALSITLTAFSSLFSILTIPVVVTFSLQYFLGDGSQLIELPFFETVGQIFLITLLPVSIGMLIRNQKPDFAKRMETSSRIASAVLFILVVFSIIIENKEILGEAIVDLGLVAMVLNITSMIAGFLTAHYFQLSDRQTLTISVETGIQNCALAIVIATTLLHQPAMALPAGIYSLAMYFTGGILMVWRNYK